MNIHCIGIGGIGISALARLFKEEGHYVQGSEITPSPLTDELKNEGFVIFDQHDGRYIKENIDWVIYTEAIDEDNPERIAAEEQGKKVSSYFEALGEWSVNKTTIAIIGTHGKTTTTAMTGLLFAAAYKDPTVVVGTKVKEFEGRNIRVGRSDILIVEGCEYRESFQHLHPDYVLLTNCEPDHFDYYKDEDAYRKAFVKFLERVPAQGFVLADLSDPAIEKMVSLLYCDVRDLSERELHPDVTLQVPGAHNRKNALFAQEIAKIFGIPDAVTIKSLSDFEGTWRRFEKKGEAGGITVIDDYGHHPTEVQATLAGAREAYPQRRIICVFQPHQYSRTKTLLKEFAESFNDADIVIVPNIYEARDSEKDKKGISAQKLVQAIHKKHTGMVTLGETLKNTVKILSSTAEEGDLIITMGAGDVWKVGEEFLAKKTLVKK